MRVAKLASTCDVRATRALSWRYSSRTIACGRLALLEGGHAREEEGGELACFCVVPEPSTARF